VQSDEFAFVFPFSVQGKPVVEVFGAHSPILPCTSSILDWYFLNICEHDSLWGCQGEVVFEYFDVSISDFDSMIFVKNRCGGLHITKTMRVLIKQLE
jgi:hypothetical protein